MKGEKDAPEIKRKGSGTIEKGGWLTKLSELRDNQ